MYKELGDTDRLSLHVGQKVQLSGKIAVEIWQHMVGSFDGYPYSAYFDLAGSQIVIYSRTRLPDSGRLLLRGTVVKLEGGSKNPGKSDEIYFEYHLLVDEYDFLK